ncbi:acylphosphatase [Azorhizobium sp. AG788]|uniref:acylphosphatase n=1 Tax=Azorhizobium sp. AG788 TaxID=2183897 RepID=UPI003139903C
MNDHGSVHVMVRGRVQGVGYRAWCADAAEARGLTGFVRNRRDGAVEAVFAGPSAAVDAMVAECRSGPAAARVDAVLIQPATDSAPDHGWGSGRFLVLPTL